MRGGIAGRDGFESSTEGPGKRLTLGVLQQKCSCLKPMQERGEAEPQG